MEPDTKQWDLYDMEDEFDDEAFQEDSSEFEEEEEMDKRDPAFSRKRQLSGSPMAVQRPKLKRVMSNSEQTMCFLGDFHVNDAKTTSVDMATPGRPDHSYSAVGFNIHGQPKGHVIRIKGFSIGGMLERVRIYVIKNMQCHVHRENVHAWTKVYDRRHKRKFNDKNIDVLLNEPLILCPTENYAFYIHSDRHDDLGLKYRSCNNPGQAIVHQDSFILITRGFAHTSPIPFDPHHGWFRESRVLSGCVYYDAIPIRWTNFSHECFPERFRLAIVTLRSYLVDGCDWHDHIVDNIIE